MSAIKPSINAYLTEYSKENVSCWRDKWFYEEMLFHTDLEKQMLLLLSRFSRVRLCATP